MSKTYQFKGLHSFEEYLECHQHLAAKRRRFLRGIMALYGIAAIGYAFWGSSIRPEPVSLGIGGVLLLYAIVISPIQFRYRVRRLWERHPTIKREFAITVGQDGIHATDDAQNQAFTAWSSFLRFEETRAHFLLYLSPNIPCFLPKRLALESDHPGIRQLLQQAGRP